MRRREFIIALGGASPPSFSVAASRCSEAAPNVGVPGEEPLHTPEPQRLVVIHRHDLIATVVGANARNRGVSTSSSRTKGSPSLASFLVRRLSRPHRMSSDPRRDADSDQARGRNAARRPHR
jgi:hypothetical protein